MSNNFLKSFSDNDLLATYQVADRLSDLMHLHRAAMYSYDDYKTATRVYELTSFLLKEIERRDKEEGFTQHFNQS